LAALAYETFSLVFLYRIYIPKFTQEFHTLIGWSPFYQYVLPGLFLCFVTVYSLYVFVDSLIPLCNEKQFKRHFVRDADERLTLIKEKSGTNLFRVVFLFETAVAVFSSPSLSPVELGTFILNLFALLFLYGLFRMFYLFQTR
jgi:hypothetical protein